MTFLVGGLSYRVLFEPYSVEELGADGVLRLIRVVQASLVNAQNLPVATGDAFCSPADTYSEAKGYVLALSRMLDRAEDDLIEWTRSHSAQVVQALHRAMPDTKPVAVPLTVWTALLGLYTLEEGVNLLLPYIDAPEDSQPPPMPLTESIRETAKEFGIPLGSPVGALTLDELHHVYRAIVQPNRG